MLSVAEWVLVCLMFVAIFEGLPRVTDAIARWWESRR